MALEIEKLYAAEARGRQGARSDITQKIAEGERGEAREKAAKAIGTNRQYVSDAKHIAAKAPRHTLTLKCS